MLFCQKCGGLLIPKKEGSKTLMVCSKCGFKSKEKEKTIIETVKKGNEMKMDVVEEERSAHPLVDTECPKCKHNKAYYWEIQTRASDEPQFS